MDAAAHAGPNRALLDIRGLKTHFKTDEGMVHAVDPDDNGKILWEARVGNGGTLGGVQWGSSTDGTNVYVALSDIVRTNIPNSLGSNADPKQGGGMFAFKLETGERLWYTPPAGCGASAKNGLWSARLEVCS